MKITIYKHENGKFHFVVTDKGVTIGMGANYLTAATAYDAAQKQRKI